MLRYLWNIFGAIMMGLVAVGSGPSLAGPLEGPPISVEVSTLEGLRAALQRATPGSIVRLAAGTYQIYADDPYFLIKNVQGLPDQPILIQGAVSAEDGKRSTIIDGGRSLSPMLEIKEDFHHPGSRPIELQDLLLQTPIRAERAINCFVMENVVHVVIENLTIRNCWPTVFLMHGNTRYISMRSLILVGATYPIFAGRYSDHLLVENSIWTQDPSGYTDDQSGYSGRFDPTPRPSRMWDTIPWGVVHHGSRVFLNGGLVGSFRTIGNVIVRHNQIRNAYNGVRLRANLCPRGEICSVNIEIYDNDFQFIRDNPVEPEDYAVNWWIFHNRIYNGHGWFSLDGVRGGPIFIFGNVGWFDDKPARLCAQKDWAGDQILHSGTQYSPTLEGECTRSRTGKVIKLGTEPVRLVEPIYIFNNSWFVRAPVVAGGRSRLRFWNNAIEFCDPRIVGTNLCIADLATDPECVRSPIATPDPLANPYPIGLDRVSFYDCFAPSPGDEYTHSVSNHPDFPAALKQQGRPFQGWQGNPGFLDGTAGDFHLRPDALAKGKGCIPTRASNGALSCVSPAPTATGPDVGAYQGEALVQGPSYLNHGDEAPRVTGAIWLTEDGSVRLQLRFSTPMQNAPGSVRLAIGRNDGEHTVSEPCEKPDINVLACLFTGLAKGPDGTETVYLPRSLSSAGGQTVTLWAAAIKNVAFQQ